MTNRREAMKLLLGTYLMSPFSFATSNQDGLATGGCWVHSIESLGLKSSNKIKTMDSGLADQSLITSSGNKNLDKSLGKALVRIANTFNERPGFGFIDDTEWGRNAFASPEKRVRGTWGTVMFGQNMFEWLMSNDDNGMSVLAVIAHEFGHIAQQRSGMREFLLRDQQTVKRLELHADLLAGYYLGIRKKENKSIKLWSAGRTFSEIGDYAFNNRNHHGTPEERVGAAEAGFKLGYERFVNFDDVFSSGAEYIVSNF